MSNIAYIDVKRVRNTVYGKKEKQLALSIIFCFESKFSKK
jgi:hypothetical protein